MYIIIELEDHVRLLKHEDETNPIQLSHDGVNFSPLVISSYH